jgi:hypothetical protein
MLILDLYSLVPAFTLASFLAILLWPENISYRNRLRFFMGILCVWIVMSWAGLEGYGTTENPTVCLINMVVGLLGFLGLCFTHHTKPSRK